MSKMWRSSADAPHMEEMDTWWEAATFALSFFAFHLFWQPTSLSL